MGRVVQSQNQKVLVGGTGPLLAVLNLGNDSLHISPLNPETFVGGGVFVFGSRDSLRSPG